MWLITPIGFFSVVQKPSDVAGNTLTIRARLRGDLDALRAEYLPSLGETQESQHTDYRFRAVAPRAAVAQAMAEMINSLDYSNFKSRVQQVQGAARAHLYHDVWDVLYGLQTQAAKFGDATSKKEVTSTPKSAELKSVNAAQKSAAVYHPQVDEHGKKVLLKNPSQPSDLAAWHDPQSVACVIPMGPMPVQLNDRPFVSWHAPTTAKDWEALAGQRSIAEPAFQAPAGYKKACGVVILEPDGRIWVVAPSNGFAGYRATFPKGTMDGLSTQATALREAYEESGLQVRLLQHLVDCKRSQSYTRYYLAERIAGTPSDMGWESQAVLLVPKAQRAQVLHHANDQPVLAALEAVGV